MVAKPQKEMSSVAPSSKLGRLAHAMLSPHTVFNESSLLHFPGESGEENSFYQFLKKREAMYSMLGRIYRIEADQEFIEKLRQFPFPTETENSELATGAQKMASLLCQETPDLDDLAADYAHTFLAAGITDSRMAIPYESVYTSPQGLVMQDAFEQVLRIFYRFGFASGVKDVYFDQLGLELEFMAFLCRRAEEAIERNSPQSLSQNLRFQRSFLQDHLLNWVPAFTADMKRYAETSFYQAAALMTSGFLEQEKESFAGC